MNIKETKLKIIEAGHRAVEQLIKVAKEAIIKHDAEDDISADRLKNAAATKKLAIFDAFEILTRIENEREALKNEYHKKSRRLEQNHDKNVRLLEKECRRDAFNLERNRLDIEPDACKKKLCRRKSLGGTQDLSRMTTMPASGNCGENR